MGKILNHLVTVSLASGLLLMGGCSKSMDADIAELEQLRTENAQLKAQLAALSTKAPEKASARAASGNTFDDLADYSTRELIEDLATLGVFDDLHGSFEPDKPITRGEYITWLYRANNAIRPSAEHIRLAPQIQPKFSDLKPEHPAYKYVQALANAGYSVGYEDGTFKPDQPLTREEMIAIKVGLDVGAVSPDPSQMAYETKFSDASQVDKRYTGYILKDRYIGGKVGGNIERAFGALKTFQPKAPVLRHEAAATLWQLDQFGHKTAGKALEDKTDS